MKMLSLSIILFLGCVSLGSAFAKSPVVPAFEEGVYRMSSQNCAAIRIFTFPEDGTIAAAFYIFEDKPLWQLFDFDPQTGAYSLRSESQDSPAAQLGPHWLVVTGPRTFHLAERSPKNGELVKLEQYEFGCPWDKNVKACVYSSCIKDAAPTYCEYINYEWKCGLPGGKWGN